MTTDDSTEGTNAADVLVFTSESWRGTVVRWSPRVIACLFALFFIGMSFWMQGVRWKVSAMYPFDPVLFRSFTFLMGVLFAALACIGGPNRPRGAWRISPEGIEFEPLRGTGKRLAWGAIESVSWNSRRHPDFVRLRGEGVTIRVDLLVLSRRAKGRALCLITTGLDPSLTPRRGAPLATLRQSLLIGVPLAAVFFGGIALLAHFDPSDEWYVVRRAWIALWWFALAITMCVFLARDRWQTRQN